VRAVTCARMLLRALVSVVALPRVKSVARRRIFRPAEFWTFSAALTLLIVSSVAVWRLWPPPLNRDKPAHALPAESAMPNKTVGGEQYKVPVSGDADGVPAIGPFAELAAKEASAKAAAELAAKESADKAAAELAAAEATAKAAVELAAKEAAANAAAELAVKEASAKAAAELAAKESADKAADELAATESTAKAAVELAAKESADKSVAPTRPIENLENKTEPPNKQDRDGFAAPAEPKAAVAPAEPEVFEPPKPDRLAEARTLVESGDIEAARTLLNPLAADNDPTALLMLGETFDPNMLAAWDARGTIADADRARGFYWRALAQGEFKAWQRLEALE